MSDPRLERLRDADSNGNAYLVPEMRDAWPAVVALVEGLLERHEWRCAECGWGREQRFRERCLDAKAALAVLDRIGDGDD
jgi:hypothetical protein